MNAKKTMPSKTLYQGMPYVNAASTDIKARFEAMKRERIQQKSANVEPIRKVKS